MEGERFIVFTIAALPGFKITVRGISGEPTNFFHQDVTLLPAAAPDEWCFALPMFFSHVGPRESLFRVRLPADPTSAGITKELTSGRWAIEPKVTKRTRTIILAASTYSGLDLPPVLAPAILAARTAAAKQPFASADIIASALQPHIIDSVVRFAISSGRDIARIALVGHMWREGVEGWMLTPRQEPTLTNVKKPPRTTLFDGIPVRHSLDDRTRWTGLPSVMGTLERWMFRTPADAAALVALSRTRVHPDPGVATRLKGAF